MKKKLFYLALACLPLIASATKNNMDEPNEYIPSSMAASFDIGPVMCKSTPSEVNMFYTFYVPVQNVDAYSLRYEWRVDPSNVAYDYQGGNSIGLKFTQSGWYLVWVDVYDNQGNKKSASMTVSVF